MATKILIVEDEKEISGLLKYNLEANGYSTTVAYDGESALSLFKKSKPDMILLDLMVPKVDGMEICKMVRRESRVPIIILTAKKSETDRVLGLELGADDYVTKPFSVRELLARVKSVLRRSSVPAQTGNRIHAGKLEVDLEKYDVKLNGKAIGLSAKEFSLLKVFLQAGGKVLTRDQLLETVWGMERASEIESRTVDQHVARLRGKLGVESGRLVTVKNIGYKLRLE
ncbi:MAG: response regulator transcription factor [Elusimicrobia bacterium]|nr:response regulator transcription factor [Elusimicrobiota bacterium]